MNFLKSALITGFSALSTLFSVYAQDQGEQNRNPKSNNYGTVELDDGTKWTIGKPDTSPIIVRIPADARDFFILGNKIESYHSTGRKKNGSITDIIVTSVPLRPRGSRKYFGSLYVKRNDEYFKVNYRGRDKFEEGKLTKDYSFVYAEKVSGLEAIEEAGISESRGVVTIRYEVYDISNHKGLLQELDNLLQHHRPKAPDNKLERKDLF